LGTGSAAYAGAVIGIRSKSSKVNHPVLQVVENTGEILWLGVRDVFRNWLTRAA
jgi:hypothetical protein